MLTHPDPQIQALFNDIAEQRDASMVAKVNATLALTACNTELEAAKARISALEAQVADLTRSVAS